MFKVVKTFLKSNFESSVSQTKINFSGPRIILRPLNKFLFLNLFFSLSNCTIFLKIARLLQRLRLLEKLIKPILIKFCFFILYYLMCRNQFSSIYFEMSCALHNFVFAFGKLGKKNQFSM